MFPNNIERDAQEWSCLHQLVYKNLTWNRINSVCVCVCVCVRMCMCMCVCCNFVPVQTRRYSTAESGWRFLLWPQSWARHWCAANCRRSRNQSSLQHGQPCCRSQRLTHRALQRQRPAAVQCKNLLGTHFQGWSVLLLFQLAQISVQETICYRIWRNILMHLCVCTI